MEFACLQHLDMIKLRLGFGEFDRISELLQNSTVQLKPKNSHESLLDGFSFFLYLRRSSSQDDSTTKIHFKAVIIDIFR